MAASPLEQLDLTCASAAEHLGFVALADVAAATARSDCRVIGGQMTTLHVLRWRLDLTRVTQDVDLGVTPLVAQSTDLTDELKRLGYMRSGGNRFEKPVDEIPAADGERRAVVDVLVPATRSRARHNRKFGEHLVTTEVPGLAAAFRRQPVNVHLAVTLLNGSKLSFPVCLPDEVAALTLRIMARTVRREDRDAFDVWRALEICASAGILDIDFGPDEEPVRQVLNTQFRRDSEAIRQIGRMQNLPGIEVTRLETRIQALIKQMLR